MITLIKEKTQVLISTSYVRDWFSYLILVRELFRPRILALDHDILKGIPPSWNLGVIVFIHTEEIWRCAGLVIGLVCSTFSDNYWRPSGWLWYEVAHNIAEPSFGNRPLLSLYQMYQPLWYSRLPEAIFWSVMKWVMARPLWEVKLCYQPLQLWPGPELYWQP